MDGCADDHVKGPMRIGELDDAIGKDLLARREAIGADLARLGAKLAEPRHGAVKPTGAIADTVRLSPEARAAHFSRHIADLPLAPFPSPVAVVTALKDILAATSPAAQGEAAGRLGDLVRQLAAALSPSPAGSDSGSHPAAAALVRTLLSSVGTDPGRVAALVLELVTSFPAPGTHNGGPTIAPTTFERAAVAILVAVAAAKAGQTAAVPGAAAEAQFPAALMAFLAPPPVVRKRRRESSKKLPPEADAGAKHEGEDDYLPDSRLT
jgi:hypothetical protein